MSYSFEMAFMSATDKTEAFAKADQFVKILMEPQNAKKMIQSNLLYFMRSAQLSRGQEPSGPSAYYLEAWLSAIFTVRFTYWPEHKLLGILGGAWPESCLALTAGTILFQNGTDQDYDEELWPKLPFFQEQIEAAKKLSVKEMAQTADLDPADIERNPEYWRRSTIYQKIADVLKLDTWLYYFKGSGNFERFAMNGINCSDMSTELFTRALDLLAKGKYD